MQCILEGTGFVGGSRDEFATFWYGFDARARDRPPRSSPPSGNGKEEMDKSTTNETALEYFIFTESRTWRKEKIFQH